MHNKQSKSALNTADKAVFVVLSITLVMVAAETIIMVSLPI